MKAREFDLTIRPDGSVQIHVKGYRGKRCVEAVKLFEDMVGPRTSEELTREYYEPDESVEIRTDQRQ